MGDLWDFATGLLSGTDFDEQELAIQQNVDALALAQLKIDTENIDSAEAIAQAQAEVIENPATLNASIGAFSFDMMSFLTPVTDIFADIGASFTDEVDPDPGTLGAIMGDSINEIVDAGQEIVDKTTAALPGFSNKLILAGALVATVVIMVKF